MRHRRQTLQVSTFPFLAVLLCTMGSLILLLLVIDRRAKAVARAKAVRAAEKARQEDTAAARARAAELDRRRQALHEMLSGEDSRLVVRVRNMKGQVHQAANALAGQLDRREQLQAQLRARREALHQKQQAVHAGLGSLAEVAKDTGAARAELARMAADLRQLEDTLAELRAARARQEQTFSLVPYHGRNGDRRKPIYVECAARGIIFHPDGLILRGPPAAPAEIRAEVERRIAQRPPDLPAGAGETPYLLMLVRPDGILNYYRAQAALDGLKVDFGYEFVESDWVLAFPEGGDVAPQPWMTAASVPDSHPGRRGAVKGVPRPSRPWEAPTAVGAGGPPPSTPATAPSTADTAVARQGDASSAKATSPGTVDTAVAHGLDAGLGSRGGLGGVAGKPPGSTGAPFGTVPGGTPGPGDVWAAPRASAGAGLAGEPRAPASRPGYPGPGGSQGGIEPPQPGDPSSSAGSPPGRAFASPGARPQRADPRDGGAPLVGLRPASPPGSLPGNGLAGPDVSNGLGNDVVPPRPSGAPPAENSSLRLGPPTVVANTIPGTGGAPGPTGAGSQASAAREGQGSARGTGTRSITDPTGDDSSEPSTHPAASPPGAGSGGGRSRRPQRVTPALRFGDRDWVIPLECTADGVTVLATRARIGLDGLTGSETDNPLLSLVQKTIDKRQAMVLPGEPPYHPIIRFRVRPDAIRTYYLAFPMLQKLGVPMTREDIEPAAQTPPR